jgi:nicotinamide riboside kinase
LLGAECTGKTTLAHALAKRLAAQGLRVAVVDEYLREWCEQHARTPQQHEQAGIATEQAARIEATAAGHELVLCDTTPFITALCSQHYFDDDSLLPMALAFQRRCDLTLLCAPDLPWEADGIQRDGPEVRARFDARLRAALQRDHLPWVEIAGAEDAREASAGAAISGLFGLFGLSGPFAQR